MKNEWFIVERKNSNDFNDNKGNGHNIYKPMRSINNTILMKYILLYLALLLSSNFSNAQEIKETEEIASKNFKNLYKVNDSLYRSEQPSKKGFKELEASGVKTIVNLRRLKDDKRKAKGTQLKLEHIRLATKKITENDVIKVLKTIHNAEKPVLIHCWHGSDRTGIVTAAYRIIFENWTKEDAIAEFRQPAFGYHEKWYPHLLDILKNLNIARLKAELDI